MLHDQMGYTKPPGDGYYSTSRDKGGSDHYDIYIRSIPSKYYGYVQPEEYAQGKGDNEKSESRVEKNAFTSYMAIRNNYKNFVLINEAFINCYLDNQDVINIRKFSGYYFKIEILN